MADDWWSDLVLTAPAGGGKAGMSGSESTELSASRKANTDGRQVFPLLAETLRVAGRYPGGNPNAVLSQGMLGVGSNAPQHQDYALFNVMAKKAAIAKAKLLGANPSNRDMQSVLESQASPELRYGNNQKVIGLDYQEAARKYFENTFKQRWAARNGGLNARDKQGRSYPEALDAAFKRPEVKQQTMAPWARNGGGTSQPRRISGDAEFDQLPSGAQFIGPDGKLRIKP